jgi:hypothetical protein
MPHHFISGKERQFTETAFAATAEAPSHRRPFEQAHEEQNQQSRHE